MKLSIIIPIYNSEKFLSICLESLLIQDIKEADYEIIVINDGSTDNSLNIVTEIANNHANIDVFSKTNGGVGSARNKGMSLAKGDYIYFIDPDDYLAPNVLKTLLTVAETNDLDILTFISQQTTDSKLHHKSSEIKDISLSNVSNGLDYIANLPYQNEVWWYLIKRSFMEEAKIQFIEDRWMEDAIITAQLFLKTNRMAHLPLEAHSHLIFVGSAMTSKEPTHYLKVIDDNRNAALVFETLIDGLEQNKANPLCIERLRMRQQSFVFFMMIRMIKSVISIKKVKHTMEELSLTNAYPLTSFPGMDYKGFSYTFLTWLFNSKKRYYILFRLFNPVLKKMFK